MGQDSKMPFSAVAVSSGDVVWHGNAGGSMKDITVQFEHRVKKTVDFLFKMLSVCMRIW